MRAARALLTEQFTIPSHRPSCPVDDKASAHAIGGGGDPATEATLVPKEIEAHHCAMPEVGLGDRVTIGSSRVGGNHSAAVFYVDPEVFDFAPPNQIVERLADLQARGKQFPFPSSPCRNYNALAAGFDREKNDYAPNLLWAGVPESAVPADIGEVIEQWKRFEVKVSHPHFHGDGVRAIGCFLKAVQECCGDRASRRQWGVPGSSSFRLGILHLSSCFRSMPLDPSQSQLLVRGARLAGYGNTSR